VVESMNSPSFARRRADVLAALEADGLDALLVTDLLNLRYLTGFTGSTGFLLLSDRPRLLVDGRYAEQAAWEAPGVEIDSVVSSQLLPQALVALVAGSGRPRIGFEAATMTVAQHARLAGGPVELVGTDSVVEHRRMRKDADEIARLRATAELAVASLEAAWEFVRPGRSELEIAGEIERAQRSSGSEGSASLIVATGARTSLPHAAPSSRVLEADEPVLIDVAPILAGYRADITRLGYTGAVPPQYLELLDVVRGAQEAAFAGIRPGMTAKEVDQLVRGHIEAAGHGELFIHASGHGLGLDVHEPPVLSPYGTLPLEPGMVIMIEPGLYVPGAFGVRLEDAVVVTDSGCEVLLPTPSEVRVCR
jgi:Xaa-Pro aminopeptidase